MFRIEQKQVKAKFPGHVMTSVKNVKMCSIFFGQ